MSQSDEPRDVVVEPDPRADRFYEGAYGRMAGTMVFLTVVFSVAALVRFDWRAAAGFFVGCCLAGINFLWMKRAIVAFAGRMAEPKSEDDKAVHGSATRFAARYGVIAASLYVIFKSSIVSLSGVLVGLFLPVAAILAEAVYETYVALRRGL